MKTLDILSPSGLLAVKSAHLNSLNSHWETHKLEEYLGNLSDQDISKLNWGNLGTIIFDTIFDKSLIPQDNEREYEKAFNEFFKISYPAQIGKKSVVLPKMIFRPEESKFYDNPKLGSSSPDFLRDWIANFRSIFLMLQHFRPGQNNLEHIKRTFTEICLWRIFEEGGYIHEELLETLSISDQNRLLEQMSLLHQLKSAQSSFQYGDDLNLPEQPIIFTIENQPEAGEDIDKMVSDNRASLISQLNAEIFQQSRNWQRSNTQASPKLYIIPDILSNAAQLQQWIDLALGLEKGKLPALRSIH